MTKKRRDHAADARSKTVVAPRRRKPLTPDVPVGVLSLLGMLLTGYLTITALGRELPAFCTTGSGCDVVQGSQFSTLFGAPMALFGFGLYLLLALGALFASTKPAPWRRQWLLALVGVSVSVYLTLAGWIALGATCIWCMASLALIVAIFVVLTLRRPAGAPGLPWPRFLANNAIVLLTLFALIGAAHAGWLTPPENPRLKALAEHLDARGVKFYGSSTCPVCREQKALFGRSAERLPYVECTPNGPRGAIAFACVSANVQGYPTWVIRGRPYQEMLKPEDLARRSGFDWSGFKEPAAD